jgi:DNA ligase-1
MSEKMDGVRAIWTGEKFLNRKCNMTYDVPQRFADQLPKGIMLDGELCMGRGRFQESCQAAMSPANSPLWDDMHFYIFDIVNDNVFEDRKIELEALNIDGDFALVLEHQKCTSRRHLDTLLELIEDAGGEGVMLRKPASKYTSGRSDNLLKLKSFVDDDAIVVAHVAGLGKFNGMCGALEVKLARDPSVKFSVGSGMKNKDRAKPPPIGSTIVFKYQELTAQGVPRFPVFIGVRADVP